MGLMRDVAIIGFAQTEHVRAESGRNEFEMLRPVIGEVFDDAGVTMDDVDFVCSGSSDYLAGQAFSFVMTLDAIGPWPPISESHVDMDGAWAVYEAWVKMQIGDGAGKPVDVALVYSYGKSSPGDIGRVLSRQLDPYYEGPLWADSVALAGLQARALLDAGIATEADFARVAADNRRKGLSNPWAQVTGDDDPTELLSAPYLAEPLRRHDCPPVSDGAVAVVLAAGDRARELCERPAWIRGIDHRIDPHLIGMRDLTDAPSARMAAEHAGVGAAPVAVAELHAPFGPQEIVLRRALGLGDDVDVNPSGGAMCANPVMAAGLIRMGEAARRVRDGSADRALAHATSGHCLQQNLVCVLEGD